MTTSPGQIQGAAGHIVVLNDTAVIAHHGCKIVMQRIIDEVAPWGFEIKTVSVYSDWRIFEDIINQAVAVIVNGEGTLHHSADRGFRLVEVAPHCQRRGIPVFLINSVWQDNSDQMAEMAQAFLLRSVRESRSLTQMTDQGLSARMVPDLTLGYGHVPSGSTRSGRVYSDAVGMPVTDMIYRLYRQHGDGEYVSLEPPIAHRGSYSDHPAHRLQVSEGSDAKRARKLATVRFFKRALIIRGRIKYWIRQRLGHITELAVVDFMRLLESRELVITGRFHVVCLCLVTGTPFLAVASNSHKVEGMLEDAGLSHRMVAPVKLEKVLANPPEWSVADQKAAADFVARATTLQSQLFADIREQVEELWKGSTR
jgi:hypothetical protein